MEAEVLDEEGGEGGADGKAYSHGQQPPVRLIVGEGFEDDGWTEHH